VSLAFVALLLPVNDIKIRIVVEQWQNIKQDGIMSQLNEHTGIEVEWLQSVNTCLRLITEVTGELQVGVT